MINRTLQNGKYGIVRVFGQGGFGITYDGVQTGLNRRVAIKEFFMSDNFTIEADVYALAATLLFMLTGRTPYKAGRMSDAKICSWLTGVSNHVVNAIIHGMAVLKDIRIRPVRGFIAELDTSDTSYSEQSRFAGGCFLGKKTNTEQREFSTKKKTVIMAGNSNNVKYLKIWGMDALAIFDIVVVVAFFSKTSSLHAVTFFCFCYSLYCDYYNNCKKLKWSQKY